MLPAFLFLEDNFHFQLLGQGIPRGPPAQIFPSHAA